MAKTKKQHLSITVRQYDRDGELRVERTKSFTSHERYLRTMGQLARLDYHMVERTESTVELRPTEQQQDLFETS